MEEEGINLALDGGGGLRASQIKVLLHDVTVCKDNSLTVMEQTEHDEQLEKYGSKRNGVM